MANRLSLALRNRIPAHSTARLLSSSSSSPFQLAAATAPPLVHTDVVDRRSDILGLDDPQALFASVPSSELLRSAFNLYLASCGPLVDVGSWLMASPLMRIPVVRRAVKVTVYEHFCAGEGVEEAGKTLRRMWDRGLRGILDYGLEDAEGNEDCDRNLEEFLQTVEMTPSLPPSSVSFACVKVTAICPIRLLERVSDLLRWQHRHPSFHLPWKVDCMPILTDSSPLYHTRSAPPPLSDKEEADLQLAHKRLEKLASKCSELYLPLLVDAEYTSVQPAIDYFTYSASISFNKRDVPIVFGTIQAYLKDAEERVVKVAEDAERRGIMVGLKLVRGAYISRETKLASSLQADSPIHSCIRDTHECYDSCAAFMLEKVAKGSGSVVLATHNINSGKAAASKAEELGISKRNENLHFAQLKGMADTLSLGLKSAGFQVSKYLPFGPLEKVIPYLLRRAEENKGLLLASSADRLLIRALVVCYLLSWQS
ncbi:proline dehydrogenase 1, mitochondrial-like isoform X2 [Nymphaea colorata]|uniref:proline dehydrogenase 1, mitochondrial-like isoform X2 n=1 Tax=Nymphaea colorata TaxID=210225 RepID=UPI00129E43E5|nr:proline dehydrogenase 1, mitochondrial-like isoform X2 [Nymphaea colorata]